MEFERRKIFSDPSETVNKGNQQFEVDLFSDELGIVVEATTYLGREEFGKCEKLVRIREFFEKELGRQDIQLFLFSMAIDKAISQKVADFCVTNRITLFPKIE